MKRQWTMEELLAQWSLEAARADVPVIIAATPRGPVISPAPGAPSKMAHLHSFPVTWPRMCAGSAPLRARANWTGTVGATIALPSRRTSCRVAQ
jgi:hypothetical protein